MLLTGEFPNEWEIEGFKKEMFIRGQLTADQENLIKSLPKNMHPMTQLSTGILACQPGSKFAKEYQKGIRKTDYWQPILEDGLDLCAKISRIASLIYHNCYGDLN